jgi:hypothetical protein
MSIKLAKSTGPDALELLSVSENHATKTVIIAFSPLNPDTNGPHVNEGIKYVDLFDSVPPIEPVAPKLIEAPKDGELSDADKEANDKASVRYDEQKKAYKVALKDSQDSQDWTAWQNDARTNAIKAPEWFLKRTNLKTVK